jgi:hypothetical protein
MKHSNDIRRYATDCDYDISSSMRCLRSGMKIDTETPPELAMLEPHNSSMTTLIAKQVIIHF